MWTPDGHTDLHTAPELWGGLSSGWSSYLILGSNSIYNFAKIICFQSQEWETSSSSEDEDSPADTTSAKRGQMVGTCTCYLHVFYREICSHDLCLILYASYRLNQWIHIQMVGTCTCYLQVLYRETCSNDLCLILYTSYRLNQWIHIQMVGTCTCYLQVLYRETCSNVNNLCLILYTSYIY